MYWLQKNAFVAKGFIGLVNERDLFHCTHGCLDLEPMRNFCGKIKDKFLKSTMVSLRERIKDLGTDQI